MSSIFSITFIENVIYLTPLIPLSFKGEGEIVIKERLRLSLTLLIPG